MRWIHIADLHFEEESTKQNYFETAIKELDKPDFILVAGDLHDFPREKPHAYVEPKPYDRTKEFLSGLLRHWGLEKDDIFIVPGNHDVDGKPRINALKDTDKLREKVENYSAGHKSDFEINGKHLSKRFRQYSKFIEDFFGIGHEAEEDSAGVFIRCWRNQVNILHVNTALYSTDENSKEVQGLDTNALSKVVLTEEQKKLPTLLLGHHSLFRLIQKEWNDVKAAMERLNVVAYLCGDAHVPDMDRIVLNGSGREVPCITTLVGTADSSFWSEMGVIEYVRDEKAPDQAEVTLHRWDLHGDSWFPTKQLKPIDMTIPGVIERVPYLDSRLREQVERLDWNLLPGIEAMNGKTSYPNDIMDNDFPIAKLLSAKNGQEPKRFYIFEGMRSTRGGTGKTSSLLSAYKAEDLTKEFFPVYIRLRSLRQDTIAKRIEQQVGGRWKQKLLLLLDGFDEIASGKLRQKCVSEILAWNSERHETDAIIITGRDSLESYFHMVELHAIEQDDVDRFLSEFRRYRVMELTKCQQERCLGKPLPDETDRIWDILDNPFFVTRYRESNAALEGSAARWESPNFAELSKEAKQRDRTSLMIGSLLYEVNRLNTDTGDAVERKRFILTKLLPALAYRAILADRTVDSGMPIDEEGIWEPEYMNQALASLLNLYGSVLRCWPEYSSQSNKNSFYQAWENYWKFGNEQVSSRLPQAEYVIGPLTIDDDGNYCFSHEIYQEFFAAFHIANIVHAIVSGMKLPVQAGSGMDLVCVLVEHLDHHILLQAEEILEQYWGMHFCTEEVETCEKYINNTTPQSNENLVLCQILIRFLDIKAVDGSQGPREVKRHKLYDWFQKNCLLTVRDARPFWEQYKQFYLYTVALLARDFRRGTGCDPDLQQCADWAGRAVKYQRDFEIPKADGYLHMGLMMNAVLEQLINKPDFRVVEYELKVAEANKLLKQLKALSHPGTETADKTNEDLKKDYAINTTPATRSAASSFYELLWHAQRTYLQKKGISSRLKIARKYSYISKAYLVLAALGNSGGAFNRLGLMFANQSNAMERYPKTNAYRKEKLPVAEGVPSTWLYRDNYLHSYKMYQVVCGIRRGDQPYSNLKTVELVLKGRVSLENGLDNPTSGNGKRITKTSERVLTFLEQASQKADNGHVPLSSYWHGRLLLVKAEMDDINRELYLKQACGFFRREEHGNGIREYINYNGYWGEKSNMPIGILLSAIELLDSRLREIDPKGFDSPLEDVCKAVVAAIEKQVKNMYLNTKMPKLNNENHCVGTMDVLDNINRFQTVAVDLLDDVERIQLTNLRKKVENIQARFW